MPSRKIVCLGGGSMYFRSALPDLAVAEGLGGSEVVLYDIDQEKAEIMARFGQRMAGQSGTGLRVRACPRLAEAVDGADFALSSIGGAGRSVGGIYGTSAHDQDIRIPARYGIYQIVGDTAGPAGMMMALRSIPAYLAICRELERRAPDAVLLNHSNPMACLCRAMNKYASIKCVIGLCHGVQGGAQCAAEILGLPAAELDVQWIGTNHYYWITAIRHKGRDVYGELMQRMASRPPHPGHQFSERLSAIYGFRILYPDDGHIIEFYPFLAQVRDPKELPYALRDNAHFVFSDTPGHAAPPADRAAQLKSLEETLAAVRLPEKQSIESLGALLEGLATGRRHVHIVNIPNRTCVPNLPDFAVLELEGVTGYGSIRGVYAGEAPLPLAGILHKRIAWQELVVDAAVKGDRRLALQALLLDEMAILPDRAEAMLGELLAASKDHLPQFA